jgi:general secretion pathway protein C
LDDILETPWLDSASERTGEAAQALGAYLQSLSDPARLSRIRGGVYALAAVWMVFGLADLVWSLVPAPETPAEPVELANPLVASPAQGRQLAVNMEELVEWNLFGTAATPSSQLVEVEEAEITGSSDLDGIENNAQETRLALTLQGIVSSSEPDRALAIIESKKEQAQYVVGDELPVGDRVKVAKILSDRVVIDNGGKYELLLLFDEEGIAAGKSMALQPANPEETGATRRPAVSQRRVAGQREVAEMAENYRRRLYNNPQSLAQVVRIAPVRDGSELQGYRVSAGRDRAQFEAMGFQADDIVTGVNGIALTDPGKAMELYRVMRSATEASFDVLRGGEQLTLVVELEGANPDDAPPAARQPGNEDD